jgi:hypothetical protein
MEKKSYEERQAECGLKVGDKVKILRKVADYEDGWGNTWNEEGMDDFVGRIGKIVGELPCAGFDVFLEEKNDWYYFPYFVLEKVEENETPKQPEPGKPEEKKLTSYSIFTICDQGEDFFFITATSKKETSESIIFTKESGGVWEFYKKYIVAIKTV